MVITVRFAKSRNILLGRGPRLRPMFKYIPQPNSIAVIQVLQAASSAEARPCAKNDITVETAIKQNSGQQQVGAEHPRSAPGGPINYVQTVAELKGQQKYR